MRVFSPTTRCVSLALILGASAACWNTVAVAGETALDRYVKTPDPSYSWKVVRKSEANGLSRVVLDLKSQTWRTPEDVDRTVWQHWVTITTPARPASDVAFLFIGGGSNGGAPPTRPNGLLGNVAAQTNTVLVELHAIPNQPLVFHNDGVGRKEDDLICYTWDQFLRGGDEFWPARLPMVKAAVRAMDCVQEYLASPEGGNHKINKFVVIGGSKRGWTTWCTAAVDRRVAACIPAVIDCLNFSPSVKNQLASYGFFAPAVGDYTRHRIFQRLDDPKMKLLLDIEDPYSYRDRYTMPKYVICASGDQYFCPDSSRFYFESLPGEKHLRYVPNADHGLGGSDAIQSAIAFYQTVVAGTERPRYTWSFEPDGSIRVKTDRAPKEVKLWSATNPKARDFRLEAIGRAFQGRALEDEGGGTFVARPEAPGRGWSASFVELTFDVGAPFPFKVTTGVRITPDTLPFAELKPSEVSANGRVTRAGQPVASP
jgi:PhoPQ-activated pathogenicity-related protein